MPESELPTIDATLKGQFRANLKPVLWIAGVSLALNLIGHGVHLWVGTSFEMIYLDPVPELGGDFSLGLLSQGGIMLWAAAGSVFLYSGFLVRTRDRHSGWAGFLIASGVLSLLLGLDEALLIHEQVFPVFLGIKERPEFTAYPLVLLIYYLYYFRTILETDLVVLCVILAGFGLFLVTNQVPQSLHVQAVAVEEVPKLIGIVSLLVYAVRTSRAAVMNSGTKD